VAPTVRFRVARDDVNLLLGELSEHRPAGHTALYAPLLEALLAAAARLNRGIEARHHQRRSAISIDSAAPSGGDCRLTSHPSRGHAPLFLRSRDQTGVEV
jgi:hypothetical protein